jgi:type IV secretory pathway VirD2 relaxase
MSDPGPIRGFEDDWRPPPAHRSTPEHLLRPEARARFARIVGRAPEVMVRVVGRTHEAGGLRAHLDYISRRGRLDLEDRDGAVIAGRAATRELADDWSATALADSRRREAGPLSLSVVLSLPPGPDPVLVRDAARVFARELFGARFDFVFVLHADTRHPHVHLAVRVLGDQGQHLDPRKADLAAWREAFARAARARGIEAEASPRLTRGVMRRSESMALRKLRDQFEAGQGDPPQVWRAILHEAAQSAVLGEPAPSLSEARRAERQAQIRAFYLAQAERLKRSADREDRALAAQVEAFVRAMPPAESLRLILARRLREAAPARTPDRPVPGPERSR